MARRVPVDEASTPEVYSLACLWVIFLRGPFGPRRVTAVSFLVTAYVATTMGGPAAAREIARGWAFGADVEARRAAEVLPLPTAA